MVNIREIELFDYIEIHNNKLCKKIYRLEISNLPYIVYKSDLDEVYKMVWYINYKYNVVSYKGSIVDKMINNRMDEIVYNKESCTMMTATNYIDFEMSIDEHEDFTLKYNDTLRTVYYLLINKTGLIVNKKGLISLIAELYDIDLDDQYTDKNKEYEIYIKDNSYYRTVLVYLKKELKINNIEKNTIDITSMSYMLFNSIFGPNDEMIEREYESYLSSLEEKLRDYNTEEIIIDNTVSSWWDLQDMPYIVHSSNIPRIGERRIDTRTNTVQYFDGTRWITTSNGWEA